MADIVTADFTFDAATDPPRDQLYPLYRQIMGPGAAPTVSLGSVTRAEAEAWLGRQHARYREGIDKRSDLIKNMNLAARVQLVGLADDGP